MLMLFLLLLWRFSSYSDEEIYFCWSDDGDCHDVVLM